MNDFLALQGTHFPCSKQWYVTFICVRHIPTIFLINISSLFRVLQGRTYHRLAHGYFAGNCTFTEITDTGIEATDYVTMMDGDIILNPPVTLKSDKE